MSLRGPVNTSTPRGREAAEFDGTGGRMGRVDGNQKCPLFFFILRYIKH